MGLGLYIRRFLTSLLYFPSILISIHKFLSQILQPSLLLLTSDRSPLPTGKITMEEASWVASILCIGGLIGNLFFGFITNIFGRRLPLILISIPANVSRNNQNPLS